MYVNGQLVNTEFHPAGNTIVPLTAYSGMRIRYSRVNAGYFNGILDNVCLYNHALSDQEVMDIYIIAHEAFNGKDAVSRQ